MVNAQTNPTHTAETRESWRSLPLIFRNVILRPATTLGDLSRDRRHLWWAPAILTALLVVLPILISIPIEMGQLQESLPSDPGIRGMKGAVVVADSGMPPQGMGAVSPVLAGLGAVGALFQLGFAWVIWAGALYLASVFLGRSSTFRQMFHLTVWAWLPYAVRGLLQSLYILISGQTIANPGLSGFVIDQRVPSVIPPGPGALALASILKQTDLFLIWNLFLLIVGLEAATRLPRKKALIATLVIWLALTLLGIIPAVMNSLFTATGS